MIFVLIVFLGTVTAKNMPEFARRDPTIYTMNIDEALGGAVQAGAQVEVLGDPVCGVGSRLREGSAYLTQG